MIHSRLAWSCLCWGSVPQRPRGDGEQWTAAQSKLFCKHFPREGLSSRRWGHLIQGPKSAGGGVHVLRRAGKGPLVVLGMKKVRNPLNSKVMKNSRYSGLQDRTLHCWVQNRISSFGPTTRITQHDHNYQGSLFVLSKIGLILNSSLQNVMTKFAAAT